MPLASAPLVAGSYEDGYSTVHQNVTVWRKKNVLRKSQRGAVFLIVMLFACVVKPVHRRLAVS